MEFEAPTDSSRFLGLSYITAMFAGDFSDDDWDDIITLSIDPPSITILVQEGE